MEGRERIHGQWGSGERRGADLGDGDFVMDVLKASREEIERGYRLKAVGFTLEKLARRVAEIFGMEVEDIGLSGKYAGIVPARGVFCYWAVEELGMRGDGGSAAAEINPAGDVYFSEERGAHRQRKRS